jgi:Domain of unknown function (DUF1816)
MKDLLSNLLNLVGLAWWVEVITETPTCTYYFGPFLSAKAAAVSKSGYVEDLEQEGAQGIKVTLKRFKPVRLTVADDLGEKSSQGVARTLRGQLQ